MSDNNIVKRVKTLRAALKKQGADALIVTKFSNVTYLTGFMGDDSWAMVTPRRMYLLTDSRYTEQAKKECVGCAIIERKEGMARVVAAILDKNLSVKTIAVEDCASIAVFAALKKNVKGRIKNASEVVEKLREIKDEKEIKTIKMAAEIAQAALATTMKYVKVGVSENELAGILNLNIRRLGGRESFETIVAFGANASRPHHLSGDRKLKKNDTVLIDWGVRYKGYCSDLTRSFTVGRWTESLAGLLKRCIMPCLRRRLPRSRKSKTVFRLPRWTAAREVLKKYKLPVYGHGTGHGLGLEVHEQPTVSAKAKGTLRAGQVITIEPGVYMPGVLGVRIEDDVLVTKDGCKVLSQQSLERK